MGFEAGSMNKQIIIGNVGADAEVRFTNNNTPVLSFQVATTYKYKQNDDWKSDTDWHNVVVFGQFADAIKDQITKGRKVYCEGRPKKEEYKDKEGNNRFVVKLYAEKVIPLGKRRDTSDANQQSGDNESLNNDHQQIVNEDDGLPF